jgi:hypothetical protein
MKNLKTVLITFLISMFSVTFLFAQNYKQPFNVSSKGKIEDSKGIVLGWIEADGTVKNAKGKVVGKVAKEVLLSKSGKKMAEISASGTVTSTDGKVLYTLTNADENGICKIIDASGKEVGTVHENYKQQGACALHCLKK